MFVYFSSAYPAVVKLDGAYLGRCDAAAKPVRIDSNETFVEFCPLNGAPPSGFILDLPFFSKPPSFISVADLKGGYMVRATKTIKTSDFYVLSQEKNSDAVITVFCEGSLKISIETSGGFFGDELPFFTETVNITRGGSLAAVFFPEVSALYLFDLSGAPKKVGSIVCSSYSMQNGLSTTLIKKDIAKHKIISLWETKDGNLFESSRQIEYASDFSRENLPEAVIPYAFAEEICVGGDYSGYLSVDLAERKKEIKEYLGNFIAVMPPPPFREEKEVGLIYKRDKNVYSVDYMTVELKYGKIDNIKRSEI